MLRKLILLLVLTGCSRLLDIADVTHGDGGASSSQLPDGSSAGFCGDAIVQRPIEECDDGNSVNGDSCDNNCTFPRCGNNIVDPGEACDDGNTTGGDGCSANCLSDEKCGNNIVDPGEICDDGTLNGTPGDACSRDCHAAFGCGNGIKDPGEECDDGAGNGDDRDCRSDCVINRCGDGRVDANGAHHEACEGALRTPDHDRTATPVETAACNLDCTMSRCGDGKLNQHAAEQCDDGALNGTPGDACSATCHLN